jgi:large subunit ribosomal protein L1
MIDQSKLYSLEEASGLLVTLPTAKFDETVEVCCRLGVDPRKAEENVRGTVGLPHGTGKTLRVAVFCRGDKVKEAEDAGADFVGGEELVAKIQGGWLDFDAAVATPDVMALVGRIGKLLGPRGLMPNPKVGTVTADVGKAVRSIKGGRVEFRVDKAGNLAVGCGKKSFGATKIHENVAAVVDAIVRAKPAAAKGVYLQSIYLSTTMGPSISVNPAAFRM